MDDKAMTRDDWQQQLNEWVATYDFKPRPPVVPAPEDAALFEALPPVFQAFYQAANGFRSDWFNMLPFHSAADPHRTRDNLGRANDLRTTRFLWQDAELMQRFVVFAHKDGGAACSCVDRREGAIWVQDESGIHQTNLALRNYLESCLRKVAELP
ncbi:hypothetical protein DB346_14825 [Verrucomicrobia bacterium LW23]|nr:hypothetical protein DB346_14825 [Verrucomicrobia bacterium LW23]